MEYNENPRKVYGRVEIVYSDAQISKDIETAESSNSTISHPHEVFESHLIPTIKACTMDGSSTMDGSFQMMDDTVVCGWWSGPLCNGKGTFTTKPWIELSFFKRPIISWTILGDGKLNQYPVNFTVDYKTDGKTVRTDAITDNTELQVRLEPKIEDITAIRLTISKWSTPNACAKILKFYDRLAEMYEGDALQMFEVTEEMCSEEGNYNITSDTLLVNIHNIDRKFDKGYLRSLMVLDRKLNPEIGIMKNGKIEYTKLGTFYSDEWSISQDSQWVKCNAVDRLMRLQDKTYVGLPVMEDLSLYVIAEDVLSKLGYEYTISESLKDIIVPMAYLPKISGWDALQEIANAGLCKVYVDRDDRIVVRAEDETMRKSDIAIHAGNMFSYKSSISLTEFANKINVDYCEVALQDKLTEACEMTVTLEPKQTLGITMDYVSDIAYGAISGDNANAQLTDFSSGVNSCSVTATNLTDEYQTTTLLVTGYALDITTKTISLQDDNSVRISGVVEFNHPTSELIQTQEHAEYIARTLLAKLHQGEGIIRTTWRGNPALNLGDEYDSFDRFGDGSKLVCESNKFTYDGGLQQDTIGRKIIKGG